MGDMYDEAEGLADQYEAGLIGPPVAAQDDPWNDPAPSPAAATPAQDDPWNDPAPVTTNGPEARRSKPADPARPDAVRGRYPLPDPDTGAARTWQRVTNFIKLADNTYHLELWKQRNVAKGIALLIKAGVIELDVLASLEVKPDRDKLNKIVESAQEAADAYKMSDEGTALHKSTELADYAGGEVNAAPVHHRVKVQMYLDALAAHGLSVVPDMIERVTVSKRYQVAGKFDRVFQLADGSHVIGDLKTGDSLDLSMPGIAAQLSCYQDGINEHGIFDGSRYDDSIKVLEDFGIVVHLPSTRDEVYVLKVYLDQGREINVANLTVRAAQKIKSKHVSETFQADMYGVAVNGADWYWLERLNAAHTYTELVSVSDRARSFGQWNPRLADQARNLAAELRDLNDLMGS